MMMNKKQSFIAMICIVLSSSIWAGTGPGAEAVITTFKKVYIKYPSDECSFRYSPIDFCDKKHIEKYSVALRTLAPNFNHNYILLPIQEWRDSDEQSLVAIDKNTGIVYPVPIDSFSGLVGNKVVKERRTILIFNIASNLVCIDGAILVYRATEVGKFCFSLEGDRFGGYHTTYMGHDTP
jgi:hypothetical protein